MKKSILILMVLCLMHTLRVQCQQVETYRYQRALGGDVFQSEHDTITLAWKKVSGGKELNYSGFKQTYSLVYEGKRIKYLYRDTKVVARFDNKDIVFDSSVYNYEERHTAVRSDTQNRIDQNWVFKQQKAEGILECRHQTNNDSSVVVTFTFEDIAEEDREILSVLALKRAAEEVGLEKQKKVTGRQKRLTWGFVIMGGVLSALATYADQ